ncbi:Uncharacterized protein Adt_20761 [Abeliophyllum distichum]|uniref:Transposase (putative) gypsy type domain-containing protein n=1 Tax=Abeliophyllum distichum TaxID=126358 RepID=A0ABD1SXE9_9LAMI
MSSSAFKGDALGRAGDEAPPLVSQSMEGVLHIRCLDGSMDEVMTIAMTPSLRKAENTFRADVMRWAALDVPSIIVEEDLKKLREAYRIPSNIELILPEPNERACFLRRGCIVLHLNAFVSGMRLPLHPLFRRILRAYVLASTQIAPNGWSQMVRGMYSWFRYSFGMEMPLYAFQTIYQPRKLPKKKGREEEPRWVVDDPEPDQDIPSFYGIARDIVVVLLSIYQAAPLSQRYGFILNRHRCLIELGLMFSKAEIDQGRCLQPTLACLTKQRPRVLVPSSPEDTTQKKVIEDLSREGNKGEVAAPDMVEVEGACTQEGDVPLKRKKKSEASGAGPSQPKKKVVKSMDNYASCAPPASSKNHICQPFWRDGS